MKKRVWAALAAVTLATGCHVNSSPGPSADEARQHLSTLPSLEETKVQLQMVFDQIARAADQIAPGGRWRLGDNQSTGGCPGEYDKVGAQLYYPPMRVGEGFALTGEQWSQIEAAARSAAAGVGATTATLMANQPDHHDVSFSGPGGIEIEVAYQGNLVISGSTGCRLPVAARNG